MSYSEIKQLDEQRENVMVGSKESDDLDHKIAEVIQNFCDAEAHKRADSKITWTDWAFQGQTVEIQVLEQKYKYCRTKATEMHHITLVMH